MKIDKVILSANENKDYIDFWPLVSKAWERIGIEPILIYTGKGIPQIEGNVIKIYVPFVSTVFVSQNVRLLAPVLFPDENCIISDIDSLPLSSKYFNNSVNKIEENKFVIYRPDAAASNMIPICWNLAKGKLWSQIFKVKSLIGIKIKLFFWYLYYCKFNRYRWYTDQILLKKYIEEFKVKNNDLIIELNDEITKFSRIDRASLNDDIKKLNNKEIEFSEFHMPRPLTKYKDLIIDIYEKAIEK